MITITRPAGMNVIDWTSQIIVDLNQVGDIGRLVNPDKWQDWAAQLLNNPSITVILPNPYQFTDWREWAERLCQSL